MSSTTKTLNISSTTSSGKRKKGGKSPSVSGSSKTSIVDNLLKDRKSPETSGINSKKLVLDLNSDSYILTESKSAQQAKVDAENKAMPIKRVSSPVIEPIILAAQEIARTSSPVSTLNGKPKSTVPESSYIQESQNKLDIFRNIDNVLTERPPAKTISLDLENSSPAMVIPNEPISDTQSGQADNMAETQRKLSEAQDNIAKINDKIKRKGSSEKYTKLLEQLNSKVKKYTRILNTPKPLSSKPANNQQQPLQTQVSIAPPTYNESNTHELITASSHATTKQLINPKAVKPISTIQPNNQFPTKKIVREIDEELARAQTLLQTPTSSTSLPKSQPQSSLPTVTISKKKDHRNTVFDIGTNIDTLREKQLHLQEKQRKLQDEYAHKLKQIEKMKSQKEEIQKLQSLEAERRKIYEMEQKLKTLEREQWKEQQALRKELHQIDVRSHQSNLVKINDHGELFSLKQELTRRPASTKVTALSTGGGSILSYIYDKWSAFTKLPMGEVINIPVKKEDKVSIVKPASPVQISGITTELPTVSHSESEKKTMPNTMKYAGRFVYLLDFPEKDFMVDMDSIKIHQDEYIIPFDDTWLESQCYSAVVDSECMVACNTSTTGGPTDNRYIHENYKTRIITNMGLISNCRAIEFYMTSDKTPEVALAILAMFYSLAMFYDANR